MRVIEQVKTLDCISGFHRSGLEFSQLRLPRFSPGYEGMENMFYFSLKMKPIDKLSLVISKLFNMHSGITICAHFDRLCVEILDSRQGCI